MDTAQIWKKLSLRSTSCAWPEAFNRGPSLVDVEGASSSDGSAVCFSFTPAMMQKEIVYEREGGRRDGGDTTENRGAVYVKYVNRPEGDGRSLIRRPKWLSVLTYMPLLIAGGDLELRK